MTLLAGIGLTLVCLWVGQNNGLLPVDASVEATQIDGLFNAMLAIATGLFIIVQGALAFSIFKFRRRAGDDTDAEPIEGNVPLEILWTAVPTVIVMWLAIYSFDVYKAVDGGNAIGSTHMAHAHGVEQVAASSGAAIAAPMDDFMAGMEAAAGRSGLSDSNGIAPLMVNVAGLQYAWIFTYPETGIVSGELRLPQDRPVQLNISANDVIHAFWVPEFRLKQDAIPGQETHLNFTPTKAGNYPLICAELCGAYHGAMKTRVIVQAPEEYQAWEQSQIASLEPPMTIATLPTATAALGLQADAPALEHLHHQGMAQAEMVHMAHYISAS